METETTENDCIHIFYGSQTGTAEQEATVFQLQCRERGYKTALYSIDTFPLAKYPEVSLAVFFVSTTGIHYLPGQGDPPSNMKRFWSFLLTKSLPVDSLGKMNFTVFGFGDSAYRKYNAMARKLYQRMLQLGANSMLERGLGDDRAEGGYNLALIPWKKELFSVIKTKLGVPGEENDCYSGLKYPPKPQYTYEISSTQGTSISEGLHSTEGLTKALSHFHQNNVAVGKVESNIRATTTDHFQDVRELAFKLEEQKPYVPGDVCTLYPANDPIVVQNMLSYFELSPENDIKLYDRSQQLIADMSVKNLFEFILNLSEAPKFFFFKILRFYSDIEIYHEKISEMEFEDYYQYAIREKRTLYEVLTEFKITKLPFDLFLSYNGILRPRDYSIASSYKKDPGLIRLTIALVEYESVTGRKIQGTASQYVKRLVPDQRVFYCTYRGTLDMPSDPSIPTMVIGPGTGIAPFISFLEEREFESERTGLPMTRFNTLVFFGCRNKQKDFLHKELLTRLQSEQKITLFNAFSRDQESKQYVQHVIGDNSLRIKSFFMDGKGKFRVFLAGSANKMPESVERAIKKIFESIMGNETQAQIMWDELNRDGRIQFETWS